MCAILLELSCTKILVIMVHRSPSDDFQSFLNGLADIIKKFIQSNLKLIIRGGINVNYLTDTDRKRQLDSILNSYNLFSRIHFPTRNQNGSNTAIDNIVTDILAFSNFKIIPIINGLSDHSAQLLIIKDLHMHIGTNYIKSIRLTDESLMLEFKTKLSYEVWEDVFNMHKDVNGIFNAFLNTWLQIFYSSFPKRILLKILIRKVGLLLE